SWPAPATSPSAAGWKPPNKQDAGGPTALSFPAETKRAGTTTSPPATEAREGGDIAPNEQCPGE
ncbi:hypothetical protein, partial [Klebsiella pneumoniae]|uniref:hypothetical protein n=1 Tax=Klebsiella pneumoniae TaxID=573 RepID=UPI001952ADC6